MLNILLKYMTLQNSALTCHCCFIYWISVVHCSVTFILFSNFPVIYGIHKIFLLLTHFSILPLYIISMWLSKPCISLVSVLWQCVTNPCFAVADFRVGPQQPFGHDRSSSLSKPSEYGKPGVTFRTDQAQGDSRGRRYE